MRTTSHLDGNFGIESIKPIRFQLSQVKDGLIYICETTKALKYKSLDVHDFSYVIILIEVYVYLSKIIVHNKYN